MKTIIHIGQHKTGTTSIQAFLRENRGALAQQGLYVPSRIVGYTSPSHGILAVYALAEGRFSSPKNKIIKTKGLAYLGSLENKLQKDIELFYKEAVQKNATEYYGQVTTYIY